MNNKHEINVSFEERYNDMFSYPELQVIEFLGKCVLDAIDYTNKVNNSNLRLSSSDDYYQIVVDKYKTITGLVYGGLNSGTGNWRNYFITLANFIDTLEKAYGISTWLINLENDCADDTFSVTFGFKFNSDLSNNKRKNELINEFQDIIESERKEHL